MRVVSFLFVVPSGFIYGVNGDLGRGVVAFLQKVDVTIDCGEGRRRLRELF